MTMIARAIFAVPPFPGAKCHDVVLPAASGAQGATSDLSPTTLIAAMRRHRVGGRFWEQDDLWSARGEPVEGAGDDPRLLIGAIAGARVYVRNGGVLASLHDLPPGSPETERAVEDLVACHLLTNVAYADPFTGAPVGPLELIETLASWRSLIDANRPISAAFGFAHWKRDTVDPLLWAGASVPFMPASMAALDTLPRDASIAVWKARVPAKLLAAIEAGPWHVLEVEDGFIRSAGLGADCVPPLSIVVDDLGVHYDPTRPNRLTQMLREGEPAPADLARASKLRAWLVREGVSKYGVGSGIALPREGGERRHLLVVGQVEDDRSMVFGGGKVRSNLDLLQRVRALEPDAWIVYRPHPDVEAGHRLGAIPARTALKFADAIDPGSPISALIAMADEVHVITSLAGFEALLQGKQVITHGTPFFAGWGLTRDLGAAAPDRDKTLSLDALVSAVMLRYPRYLDPVTNLPCTAEILIMRLISGVHRQNIALVPLRRLVGWTKRAAAHIVGRR